MSRTVPDDFEDYEWLRQWCEPRIEVIEPGFTVREVIRPGDVLYDVQLIATEPDGSALLSDIGGQVKRGWSPDEGHGAIYRLRPDDELEPVMPARNIGKAMVLCPVVAPEHFGSYGGDILFVGQAAPGRAGATKQHVAFCLPKGDDTPMLLAEPPHAGAAGGGVPGAMVTGTFGRPGTAHEGAWFVMSLMNRTVYRIYADGRCDVFVALDPDAMGGRSVMPLMLFVATRHWGELEGELVLGGIPDTNFTEAARTGLDLHFWRVTDDGVDPEMLPDRVWGLSLPEGPQVAAAEFGAFAGDVFVSDEGSTNQMHVTMMADGPLPYDGKILRIDEEGKAHDFAVNIQGGAGSILFDGNRMLYGQMRKSYSTGDYHEPDSSVYEIVYTGT